MKKGARIAISFLLSLLIVWIGSGIVLVHCSHSGRTEIVNVTDADDGCCAPVSDCMTSVVLTLSPVNKVVADIPAFHALPLHVAPFLLPLCPKTAPAVDSAAKCVPCLWFGSPRSYLSFIRILRI